MLINCSNYYDADGVGYAAPASVSMVYTSLAGTLEEVAHEAQPSNSLRFGYGISAEQYEQGTSLGGRRLVSPVIELDFFVAAPSSLYQLGDVNCDGYVNSSDVTMLGRHVAKIETITDAYVLSLGDVDGSGSVTAADVTHLGQYVAKIISSL